MKYGMQRYRGDPVRSLRRELWVMRGLLLAMGCLAYWAAWHAQTASVYWSTFYAPLVKGHL